MSEARKKLQGVCGLRIQLPLPQLRILRRPPSIFEYQYEDFEFVNYQHHAPIRAAVSV